VSKNGLVTKAVSDEEKRRLRGRWDTLGRISEQLAASPWVYLLIAAAAGLTAYGLYLLLAARYLRLIATW
jgi:hypothetical protein